MVLSNQEDSGVKKGASVSMRPHPHLLQTDLTGAVILKTRLAQPILMIHLPAEIQATRLVPAQQQITVTLLVHLRQTNQHGVERAIRLPLQETLGLITQTTFSATTILALAGQLPRHLRLT